MEHKFKIDDATKDELVQYFFCADTFGGGCRIPADKDLFLNWLERKRTKDLIDAEAKANEASIKALDECVSFATQAYEESDVNKRLQLFDKEGKAWKRYEKLIKQREKISAKVNEALRMD